MHDRMQGEDARQNWLSSSLPVEGFADLPLLWPEADRVALAKASTLGFGERGNAVPVPYIFVRIRPEPSVAIALAVAGIKADFEWLEENVFSVSPMLFPPFVYSLEAYTAAVALSISRTVLIEMPGGLQPTLLPIFDMVTYTETEWHME